MSTDRTRRQAHSKRMRRRAKHSISQWWRRVSATVTALGWFMLAVAVCGALAGAMYGWVEAMTVALVAGLLLVVALPFLLGSRAYRTRLVLDRPHVVAGEKAQLTVEIENTTGRPQLASVVELPVGEALREIAVPGIGGHQSVSLPVAVPTKQRGVIAVGPLTVARQDPIGLLRREVTWRERHRLHVHPRTVGLPPNSSGLVRDLEGQASRHLSDSDLSFHAVREYMPGDALRHVHWKSTAKAGALMVKQYEQSQTARMALLFDARREEYASDDEFELGVSLAASISVQAVREGRERFVASAWQPGRVRASVDGIEELNSRDRVQMLNSWAELEHADDGLPFEVLAGNVAHTLRDLSVVVLVTGSSPDVQRIRRATVPFAADVHVLAVRADLLAEPKAQRLDALTIVTVGVLGDLPQLMARGVR